MIYYRFAQRRARNKPLHTVDVVDSEKRSTMDPADRASYVHSPELFNFSNGVGTYTLNLCTVGRVRPFELTSFSALGNRAKDNIAFTLYP